ncbi:hypothetical protein [Micromonospora sp. MH33]|uniref:hypothetical protein n=1 Tax=Micromonospora sp. MH33 TaxID=1945509 RepID=UPI001AEFC134|nr:hypothetical protein [Micromonospora sp. MH33]
MRTVLAPQDLTRWRRDWGAMMRHYQPGRKELVTAGLDAVDALLGRPPQRVLDVGGGPGTTADVILARRSDVQVTVLDVDPVLLALADAALPTAARTVCADIASPGWGVARWWPVRPGAGHHDRALPTRAAPTKLVRRGAADAARARAASGGRHHPGRPTTSIATAAAGRW